MATLVVYKQGFVGSYYYIAKSESELSILYDTFSLIKVDELQFIILSNIEAYGEYHPAQQIKTIPELLSIVGNLAQNM